jgi:hypothetical protein
MTRTTDEREQRRAALLEPVDGRRARQSGRSTEAKRGGASAGRRFAPRNAVVHGGWLPVLSPRELRVWTVLDTLSDDAGRARIGGTRLGELAGCHRTNALRAVAALVRRGLVRRAVRGHSGRGTRRTSNEYEMLTPEAAPPGDLAEPD